MFCLVNEERGVASCYVVIHDKENVQPIGMMQWSMKHNVRKVDEEFLGELCCGCYI